MATSSPRRTQAQTQNPAGRTQTRSQTQTQTQTQAPVLRLRGATETIGRNESEGSGRRVQWAEGVVNNEGMGKKSSKVCCIYHAPKGIDESSDESSSDSSSDDSDSGDDGAARPAGGRKPAGHGHAHNHGKGKARARSPNAYEKMPKSKGGGSGLKENKP